MKKTKIEVIDFSQESVQSSKAYSKNSSATIKILKSFSIAIPVVMSSIFVSSNPASAASMKLSSASESQIYFNSKLDKYSSDKPDHSFSQADTPQISLSFPKPRLLIASRPKTYSRKYSRKHAKKVPEPLTILGSVAAIGIGSTLKKKYSQKLLEAES